MLRVVVGRLNVPAFRTVGQNNVLPEKTKKKGNEQRSKTNPEETNERQNISLTKLLQSIDTDQIALCRSSIFERANDAVVQEILYSFACSLLLNSHFIGGCRGHG